MKEKDKPGEPLIYMHTGWELKTRVCWCHVLRELPFRYNTQLDGCKFESVIQPTGSRLSIVRFA